MNRTQIYLTASEAQGVARVAAETGRKQSALIREAIDPYLQRVGSPDRLSWGCIVNGRLALKA